MGNFILFYFLFPQKQMREAGFFFSSQKQMRYVFA